MKALVICTLGCSLLLLGCSSDEQESKSTAGNDATEKTSWEEIQQLYQKAKSASDDVPENVVDWVKEDIQRNGTWEYRVVTLQRETDKELERELSRLGKDRWECFWIERHENKLRLALKRPAKSYLQAVPVKDLMKLIPKGE